MSALLDTGVLLDYLAGFPAAAECLGRYPNSAISVLTWVELMAAAPPKHAEATRDFLRRFERLAINEAIADRAAQLIGMHPALSLRGALAYGTARINSLTYVTADAPQSLVQEPNVAWAYPAPGRAGAAVR